jgi:chromosome segregation protein
VRLTQIKLSGFKSFVDPTHFHIPGQLVGVVGPNGCGKSNIIDAARWVLGESKASELRGESMQDVIFNGSGNRKPAARASVELFFDNPDGRSGGKWSKYAEIAVKRVLTREGNSTYHINNQVVRRRDVQDIFMGTGLGPRAYAIIGQGMISRIIEARPDELRVFLEEAAGVSKYKERRRETENRLGGTRENLTRVNDILRELGANLEKLDAQAKVAQRFRDLEAEQSDKTRLLWTLRHLDAGHERARSERAVAEAQLELEARTADLRQLEAQIEAARSAHYAAGDLVHGAQGEVYEASAAVSRLETEIKAVVDARQRLQGQLGHLNGQRQNWMTQGEAHSLELTQRERDLLQAREQIGDRREALEAHQIRLPGLDARARAARTQVDDARAAVTQVEQSLQVESAHQRNAEKNLAAIDQRRERLDSERATLESPDATRIEALEIESSDGDTRLRALIADLAAVEAALPDLENARRQAQGDLARESGQLAQDEARLATLRQVQESVQTHDKLQPWLEKHELTRLPRLWQRLHIETGWETALEAALRERIAALEVSQLDWTRGFFADAPPAKLSFFAGEGAALAQAGEAASGLVTLASRLQLDDPNLRALLFDWLAGIFLAEDAQDALQRRQLLPQGAVFVVREGHMIDRNSVRFYAADSEQAGMLARQQEIERLSKQAKGQSLIADQARSGSVRADAAFTSTSTRLTELRATVSVLTQALHGKQLELQRLLQQRNQVAGRNSQIDSELAELRHQQAHESSLRAQSEANFERLDGELAQVQGTFEEELQAFEASEAALVEHRLAHAQLERELQAQSFEERNVVARMAELGRHRDIAADEATRLAQNIAQLETELTSLSDQAAQSGLQDALAVRIEKEQALARTRTELDHLTAQMREFDEARVRAERDLDPLRARITELQLKEQAARINQEQYLQQLVEVQADVEQLTARVKDESNGKLRAAPLQAELGRIQEAIVALGAVNLAALEELSVARERKEFLDAQSLDLNEAITTLEDAIRRIDRETRSLLQETFDAVNRHFGELFPALFGGGEARLVMTGEEILDAGLQVMAQPPGKKNSTIHLLSGGEKALAATALVFAMFQLNPAPFCLLDEVDAPLDDANTDRFCALVKKMSLQTQFLFISHNKIAMEMASQLIGVTMQEQGVSRIVAVDMESAATFASQNLEKVA